MRQLSYVRTALLASLGLGPIVACSGETDGDVFRCANPTPVTGANGQTTGYEWCGEWLHRSDVGECSSLLPRAGSITGGTVEPECEFDADCTERAHGYCAVSGGGFEPTQARCHYGCVRDADCPESSICLCGEPVGHCVRADCTTDAECGEGLCAGTVTQTPCGGDAVAFACQTQSDACQSSADCAANEGCEVTPQGRRCVPLAVCGRPYLVHGVARRAELAQSDSWAFPLRPERPKLSFSKRAELIEHWTQVALMEHASVAAFARFCMQLLALGAPPELIEAAQAALSDETRHARWCFGVASAYAERPLGPGALSMAGSDAAQSETEIVRTAIAEACIGETLAAVEAQEAAERATDPVIAELLERIAADELRHAELGWKFLSWWLKRAQPEEKSQALAELMASIQRELAHEEPKASASALDPLERYGVLSQTTRTALRARILTEVVAPCARALAA